MEAELEHSASLSGAVMALRQDEHKRMTDAVERIKSEEEVATEYDCITVFSTLS